MKSKTKDQHRRFIRINGKIVGRTFSRKADAERWYQEMKRQKELQRSGIQVPVTLISVSDFARNWLDQRQSQGQPASSYKLEKARLVNYILPAMGHRPLQRITALDWEMFLNGIVRDHGISFATRNRIRALVSKMYSDAFRQDLVMQNPIAKVTKSKEAFKKVRFLSIKECERYLRLALQEDLAFHLFASIALNTGMRCGEILALQWSDIHTESRRIHIWKTFEEATYSVQERTKGGKDRWVGISDSLLEVLVKSKAQNSSGSLISRGGVLVWPKTIRQMHQRVCRKAELGHLRIHDLRHTYASLFVMNGGHLYELKEILGHSSLEMTKRYAHFSPGHLEAKANLVSLGGSASGAEVIRLSDYR